MAIDYNQWQKVRKDAQERELVERGQDMAHARPPLQFSITDQILRDLIERVQKLESTAAAPVNPFKK